MTSFNIKQLKEINILRQKVQVFRILDSIDSQVFILYIILLNSYNFICIKLSLAATVSMSANIGYIHVEITE